MRIGCLFGTFDPPHTAHVSIAAYMREACGLDEVWLVVTPMNPFKPDQRMASDQHRMAMVRLAVQGVPGLLVNGFELDLPQPNHTVDSLRFMRQRWPQHSFDLIIGSDNLAIFHRWKDATEILEHHRLLVYPREDIKEHLAQAELLGHPGVKMVADAPLLPVSSTVVRDDVRTWRRVEERLHPEVLRYIRQHRRYEA